MTRLLGLAFGMESIFAVYAVVSRSNLDSTMIDAGQTDGSGALAASLVAPIAWIVLSLCYLLAVRSVWVAPDRVGRRVLIMFAVVFRLTLFASAGFTAEEPGSVQPPLSRLEARFDQLDGSLPRAYQEFRPRPTQTAAAILADLLTISLLTTILWASGAPATLVVVYAWNPLVIAAVAGAGRIESLGVLAAVWAVKELVTATQQSALSKAFAGVLLGFALAGSIWWLPLVWLLSAELGAGVVVALALSAGLWGFEASFEPLRLATITGWTPGFGGSLAPAAETISSLLVTRDWRLVSAGLAFVFVVWSVARSETSRRSHKHRPSTERWAHRLRQILAGVGGMLFIAPSLRPTDWLTFCAFAPFAIHPSLKPNAGWLLFSLTAPLGYWSGPGAHFGWGFAQYFLPFTVVLFFALGRDDSKD